MPRPRFTIRRMMVAVAIVASVLGALIAIDRQSRKFNGLASFYRRQIVGRQHWASDGIVSSTQSSDGRLLSDGEIVADRWNLRLYRKYGT